MQSKQKKRELAQKQQGDDARESQLRADRVPLIYSHPFPAPSLSVPTFCSSFLSAKVILLFC